MTNIGVAEYQKIRRYVMNLILRSGGKSVQIPTIQELSEKFGVSRTTVSKAMKELTAEGHIIGKRGIGSFTNPAKPSPIIFGKKLPVVGVMVGDGRNVHLDQYLGRALGALLKQLVAIPAVVHLVTVGTSDPDGVIREIQDEQLDALVCCGSNTFMKDLRRMDLPVVFSFHPANLLPGSAFFDYEDWGYRCGKQLLKEGRKNIVFLYDMYEWNASYPGIRKAYAEAGVPLNENFFLKDYTTSLDELAKIIRYGIPVDAVCDTLLVNNEVVDLLMILNPELAKTCAIVHNADSLPQDAGFHEICYKPQFDQLAAETADLVKLQLEKDERGMEARAITLPLIIR